jgi:hypothetical protein
MVAGGNGDAESVTAGVAIRLLPEKFHNNEFCEQTSSLTLAP